MRNIEDYILKIRKIMRVLKRRNYFIVLTLHLFYVLLPLHLSFFLLSNLTNPYFHSLEFSSTFLHLPFFPLLSFIKHFHSFIFPFHSISLSLICSSNFFTFSYSYNLLPHLIRNFLFISHFIHQFLPFCFLILPFLCCHFPFSFFHFLLLS